jgi:hypothetical protein
MYYTYLTNHEIYNIDDLLSKKYFLSSKKALMSFCGTYDLVCWKDLNALINFISKIPYDIPTLAPQGEIIICYLEKDGEHLKVLEDKYKCLI